MMLNTTSAQSRRRNVSVLALSQALFMSVQGMGIATTPLAAHMLLEADQKWMATVPIFLVHLAIMGTTIPASLLMAAIGRRAGFSIGALLGVLNGIVGCLAMYQHSFPLLCVATVFQGMQAAFFWYFRLAAADATEPAYRAKAISLVMAGGVLAGFLGPQTAKWAVDWLAPVTFAGVYLASGVFSIAVLALVQLVQIPTLSAQERSEAGRPLAKIMGQPAYRVALASSVFGYAVMTLTMSATPLAMLACGFGFSDSATVIQAHIVAMFLPSFFTGHLISRLGVLPVIAMGGLIEFGCALVNLSGVAFGNFLFANMLVGLGWNFAYVGGSTLLTTTYTPAERAKVQASHDFLVYSATATAAALSGVLQAKAGWTVINLAAMPLMAVVVSAAVWLMSRQRQAAVPAAE
ncbi:MAG TPA: MFS transporter [Hyphomicrobiaceae bacterium]|jgi:MFS family permease|nr:MFS transporter [Hyphomicrobiaceae bacterium]